MTSEPQREEDPGGSRRGWSRADTCRAQGHGGRQERKGPGSTYKQDCRGTASVKVTIYSGSDYPRLSELTTAWKSYTVQG